MSVSQTDSLPKASEKKSSVHEKKQKVASQQPILKVLEITPIAEEEIPVIVSNSNDQAENELQTPRTPLESNLLVGVAKSHLLLGFLLNDVSITRGSQNYRFPGCFVYFYVIN